MTLSDLQTVNSRKPNKAGEDRQARQLIVVGADATYSCIAYFLGFSTCQRQSFLGRLAT